MKNDIWTVFENNAADKSDKPVLKKDKNNKHFTILPWTPLFQQKSLFPLWLCLSLM